jgi:hypothetical protein
MPKVGFEPTNPVFEWVNYYYYYYYSTTNYYYYYYYYYYLEYAYWP